MKRRSAKDKVFRPSKLWVYCPVIREIWVLGLWRKKWTEKDPSGWSFARGLSILLIICNRLIHPNDHLQEASHSRWSFTRCRSILMIICKRPPYPDDHYLIHVTQNMSLYLILGPENIQWHSTWQSTHCAVEGGRLWQVNCFFSSKLL